MTFRLRSLALVLLLALAAPVAVHADGKSDAQAALSRALIALDRGDPRTARVELMNAIKADPDLAAARVAQARALLMLGNGTGADQELDRAHALGIALGPIRHLRAHAALLEGRAEDALAEVHAPDADPKEALFRARIEGQALQMLGRYPEIGRAHV